jgi:ABC-type branched-subunit amino acid transport system ATPase component/MFS family permease
MPNHDEDAAAGGMTATELAERAEQAIEQAKVAPDTDRLVTSAVTVGQRGRIRGWLHDIRPSVVTGGLPTLPLLALMGVSFLAYFDLAIQGVAAPEIRDFFGLDLTQLGAFNTLSGVVGLLVALPVGFFADRINRSKMTAIGLAVLAAFSLLTGGAPTILVFAIARFGRGLGQSFEIAEASLLADFYPPALRPGLFAARSVAVELAKGLAPLIVGFIASVLFWQAAYFLVVPLAAVLAYVFWFRLEEPVRGETERRALGASEEVARTAEQPPSFGEALRISWAVRTLRRTYYALPFLVGSFLSLGTLISLYYQDRFNLGPGARGFLLSIIQPASIAGLVFGGSVANRVMRYKPGRIITYGGASGMFAAAGFLAAALSPTVWLAVLCFAAASFFAAILTPGTLAIITLVSPPRARSASVSISLPAIIVGVVFQFFALNLGDRYGIQAAILFMVPVFLVGSIILASAGSQVEADMRASLAAAMAAYVVRESVAEGTAKLLVVRDLDVHYGQVQILFNVDFDVEDGEIIAILGTNGAGKSTLLRAISGLTDPSNGAIFFDGTDITHLPPSEHAAKGIIQVPGGKGIFPGLSVAENLRLAAWMYHEDEAYVHEATEAIFGYFPVLRERLDEVAGNLSGGQQQMLTLGQAFLSRPRLLMIDELSLGLAPTIVAQLLEIVRAIADQGTTIVLVEQSVNIALTVAKKAVFMEKGEVRFSGPTEELMQRPDILRSVYLKGSSAAAGPLVGPGRRSAAGSQTQAREVVLELRNVTKRFGGVQAINNVSFQVFEGQILGLIGPNGAGKTTIFDIISGFVEPDNGEVVLLDDDITFLRPDERARLGLQRSFQDARLFPALTVAENIAVALERYVEVRSTTLAALHIPNVRRSEHKIDRRTERLIHLLGLGEFRDKFVRELSTGSRRLVDLACCMAAEPKVLLLDEPSSGIAQKEAEELGPLLQRIKFETGCTLVLIEHDMNLIRSISDELLALDLGAVVTRGAPTTVVEDPRVVESYLGTSEEAINRSKTDPSR